MAPRKNAKGGRQMRLEHYFSSPSARVAPAQENVDARPTDTTPALDARARQHDIAQLQQNEASQSSATPSAQSNPTVGGMKRKAEGAKSTERPSKQAKKPTAKKPTVKKTIAKKTTATKSTVGNRGSQAKGTSSVRKGKGQASTEDPVVEEPPSNEKPLFNLRDIIADLLDRSQHDGLNHYVDSGRQFSIRVGTLCSGTDAPIHVMELFGMLKNDDGNQVFTTVNSFGCEIEPFKQGFLMRNSKPQLLFRDARDFAKDGARQARLVTGTEAPIPQVDMFIAGTSCVDFSNLNSRKSKAFAGLAAENAHWMSLDEKYKEKLSLCHLSRESWRRAIDSMMEASGSGNTSTTTFASAMNYIFEHQPKIVIFENVESAPWQSVAQYVFPLCGYAAEVLRLDTKQYYLPQTRSRKYLVAFSHKAFTLEGAQALQSSILGTTENLKRMHSSSVTDFLLPTNSLELQRARNEMELVSQARRDKDTDWSFSRSRHMAFRREHQLQDKRPWIRWRDNGSSNPPAKMWKPWENRQTKRVSDLLECMYLYARYKRGDHVRYDLAFKAQIIDCSQNVDRINLNVYFGRTGCLTPCAIPVLALEARPVTGSESLKLQGLPIDCFDMSIETQEQLQDLAGNAMSTTVVGATILSALQCVAKTAMALDHNWLETMFQKEGVQAVCGSLNSFRQAGRNLDHGSREELQGLKLFAHLQPERNVQEIIDLGQQTRRRCYCYHVLAYSSVELYECNVCGMNLCKSCKGNPEHRLVKSQRSLEQLKSLPYSKAEHAIRQYFPPVLPLIAGVDSVSLKSLHRALLSSGYDDLKAAILAQAILIGLCNSTYQLRFVEITDVTRIEYTSEPNYIVRVIVEEDKLVWYLHLNEWCDFAKDLRDVHKTSRPIARAVVGRDKSSQFPRSWEFWFPKRVEFSLDLRLEADRKLRIEQVGDLHDIPTSIQPPIKGLEQSVWAYHPECGFPEDAFWVIEDRDEKLFLFKNVDPVGPADKDEFVITSISREMGRAPIAETRPVLLRIDQKDQIHLKIKDMVYNNDDQNGATIGDSILLRAFVDGWWEDLEAYSIRIRAFTGSADEPWMEHFPVRPPADIRRESDIYEPSTSFSCPMYQDLLTMSLPLLEAPEVLNKVKKTLRDLDLTHQLDLAEFSKLLGPCYFAVEQEIMKSGRHRILEKDVVLSNDCSSCAPKIPEVLFEKSEKARGTGSRSIGPVTARHRDQDRDKYSNLILTRPPSLRIDHNLNPIMTAHPKKLEDVTYVDVRFVAHGHGLLQQARSYLAQHPAYYQDSEKTRGTFAMEVGVLEDPRLDLARIEIMPPTTVEPKDAKQPNGFRKGMALFPEQINSLHWMLEREKLYPAPGFVEKEVAEVYMDHLRLRVYAHAERNIIRRGRVVADDVGFGKTAVCLGLIASQQATDRKEFLKMRSNNPYLQGMCHLHATLVIVPNQLTQQWSCEAKRFLEKNDRILVIQNFNQLQTLRPSDFETADIIICSSKVMQDTGDKYYKELSNYCGTNDIDTKNLLGLQRVYRAWYKAVHEVLRQVRGDILDTLRVGNSRAKGAKERQELALGSLKDKLNQIRNLRQATGGELRFVPPVTSSARWKPLMLLELFSFSRLIWDEFPYENLPVTEFVANCTTTSKWMLSGTPPLTTLGEICKVAYLFNVHLARPLSLVVGRQPPVCNHPPLEPLSELETTITYKSRNSPPALQERHDQAVAFVKAFMRKNTRKMDLIRAIENPLVLTTSTTCSLAYMELQQELSSRMFNANLVAADPRRRLMSRVDWTGSKLGRERSTEALMLRASGSFQDVKEQTGHLALKAATSTVEEAEELYKISDSTIRAMEDRGRELFARAFFLGYRITFITISNTDANDKQNQEDRQLNYYRTLEDIIGSILDVDLDLTSGWDAFESAARMLIWDKDFQQNVHSYIELEPDSVKTHVRMLFDKIKFCERPQLRPVPIKEPTAEARQTMLQQKQAYLEVFSEWLTKTPLHSRRSYLVDKVNVLDEVEEELLEIEWKEKVPWEASYSSANDRSERKAVVPISDLSKPPTDVEVGEFDFEHLKSLDEERREDLDAVTEEVSEAQSRVDGDIMTRPRKGRTDTKVFWKDECVRRGLQSKMTDTVARMKKRVVADEAGIATDDDYLSPESCPLVIEDFPQEGTIRIRGGTMEDIFDRLMHTVDKLTVLFDRLVIAHAKKNLQKVVLDLVRGQWRCDKPHCNKTHTDHYVSLQCGHVLCGRPDDDAVCSVRRCTHPVKDVCIPLSKIMEEPRAITAASFGDGALAEDPLPYLDSSISPHGPKARAVANLIKSMEDGDQVVVFVQSAAMMSDLYDALSYFGISHIQPEELDADEAVALERFKQGRKKVLVQVINSEQAAGSNLHNANHVIFVSPLISRSQADWDAHMRQALGRCIRFRQNKTVYVYHMLMDGTIEVDTLEWRKKQEIIVRKNQAVGRFNNCSVLDFLDRFDGDESATRIEMDREEGRAISLLPRTDIQVLMGDDYISLASARSKTLDDAAEGQAAQDDDGDIQMGGA
ncbi:Helicase domino [Cytospora mali]|uniref:Helicase domino n=1 Tax=Cytospora mali TaxID=578113 RepID=A0A194UV60_CYTMA|nr:Helicase domino [Valsa mali var. pyri (nom. inval.)]